jgi:hypothetical protein
VPLHIQPVVKVLTKLKKQILPVDVNHRSSTMATLNYREYVDKCVKMLALITLKKIMFII